MSVVDPQKLSEWEKRPKEYLTAGIDNITRQFIDFCENDAALYISYFGRNGKTEKRTIHPMRVLKDYLSGKYYTEAFCDTRNEIRIFNLQKIVFLNPPEELDAENPNNIQDITKRVILCEFSEVEIENDEGFYV